jgi:CheY-like chemotaxis protein
MDPIEILLVDDEESIRITLSALLQSYDFKVTTAASVAIALSLITQYRYDVVLPISTSGKQETASL